MFSNAGLQFQFAPNCLTIPGISASVQVPAGAVVVAAADGTVQLNTGGSVNALVELKFVVDDVVLANSLHRFTVANSPAVGPGFETWAMTRALTLDPGPHTIAVCGQLVSGSAAVFSGSPTGTPDNLTVMILKK